MKHNGYIHNHEGFSLLELMIALAVIAVVAAGILGGYMTLSHQAKEQRDLAIMQMNQRGSIENMEQEFRMAGYNPEEGDPTQFGVVDVRRYEITNGVTQPNVDDDIDDSAPALTVAYDEYITEDPDGLLTATDTLLSYRLFDETGDGVTSLALDRESGDRATFNVPREVLADNILAIGFAYAFDADENGELDTADGGEIIWAIDTDNDNELDFNLDANGDGRVDMDDDVNGDDFITEDDTQTAGEWPAGLAPELRHIRQIRIWILARAPAPSDSYENTENYLVGDRIYYADYDNNDEFVPNLRCLLMVRAIECRNLKTP